jgi:hypothetical protein
MAFKNRRNRFLKAIDRKNVELVSITHIKRS